MQRQKKLESLDALRGVAILLVIVSHFFAAPMGREVSILMGNAGVILFFFLSGFLMDRTLQTEAIGTYLTRRAFRILPLYWFSILLVAATAGNWNASQILANMTFTALPLGIERMLGVYWTLYIEVLFYCLAPLLIMMGRRAVILSTYVALAAFAVFALTRGVEKGAGFYLIFCLCGMQAGAWYRGQIAGWQLWLPATTVCAGASLLMPANSIYLEGVSLYLGPVALGCFALLMSGLLLPTRMPVLAFFGRISYSWYLLHSIFGYKMIFEPHWLAMLTGTITTLMLSYGTYRLIEKPMIDAARRLREIPAHQPR